MSAIVAIVYVVTIVAVFGIGFGIGADLLARQLHLGRYKKRQRSTVER